jgi:hypothetical protein
MATAVAYLDQNPGPEVPFRFRLGDRVVSTTDSASLPGVIAWGRSRYTLGGGAYENIYEVELPNERHFLAKDIEIRRIEDPRKGAASASESLDHTRIRRA